MDVHGALRRADELGVARRFVAVGVIDDDGTRAVPPGGPHRAARSTRPRRRIDVAAVEAFPQVPLERLGETGRERVAGPDAELRTDLRRRVDGVTVVSEVLTERRCFRAGGGRDVHEGEGLLDDLRDQLDEAHLRDALLARDRVRLAVGGGHAEHAGDGVREILHVTELAEPAAGAGHEDGPAAQEAVEEEGLVVARVSGPYRGSSDIEREAALAVARRRSSPSSFLSYSPQKVTRAPRYGWSRVSCTRPVDTRGVAHTRRGVAEALHFGLVCA